MVELYGWMAISETDGDEDRLPAETRRQITERVQKIAAENGLDIQYRNGIPVIMTAFSANHRTAEPDALIAAFTQIANIASGSYGILYLHDDEDADHANAFTKYVCKRGQCIMQPDTDLSPCIPEIEQP